MTTTLTIPKANVPIGRVTIGGIDYDVAQHPEFVRLFFDFARRVGGTTAPTNNELSGHVETLDSDAQMSRSDPSAQEALRAVDELRNEIASLRSDCDGLRSQIADRDSELAGLRSLSDLRSTVEQILDRLV